MTPSADESVRAHHGRVVLLFTVISALSAISPFVALPFVTRAAGADGFLSIATGQAIGTFAASAILFGWNTKGPIVLARSTQPQSLAWASLMARGLNGVVILPLAAAAAVVATTSTGDIRLTVVSALAFAWQGYSLNWYAVGIGKPSLSLLLDALPRLVANILGGVLSLALSAPIIYPACVLAAGLISMGAFIVTLINQTKFDGPRAWRDSRDSYRANWKPALTSSLLTFYETAPLTTLGVSGAPAATGFAPFDRILKYGYIGVYMITNSFQGWVASASGDLRVQRMRKAVGTHSLLAAALAVGFAVLAPPLTPILLGPGFEISVPTAAFGGLALGAMCLCAVLGLCVLLPSGRDAYYLMCVAVGAITIVPSVLLGAHLLGVTGAAGAVATTQLLVFTLMAIGALPQLRTNNP